MQFSFHINIFGVDNYGAMSGKYSFIIGHIKEMGWVASYKDIEYTGPASSNYILNEGKKSIDNPFKTRQQAEAACRHKLKELKKN